MTLQWIKAGLAAAFMIAGCGTATAQDDPKAAFESALTELNQRLGPAETGPAIEDTDGAANAADIAAIELAVSKLGTPAFPLEGFASFEAICEPLNRLSVRHVMDGSAALARPKDAPPPEGEELNALLAQIQALQLRNASRFEEQIIILSGSGLRCMVMHFPFLADHLASLPAAELTPVRLNGARQMRMGSARSLLGYMAALHDPATAPANKARLQAYVAELAAPLASAMTPALRTELTTTLAQLPPTSDPEVLAVTELLTSALATTECVQLCRY